MPQRKNPTRKRLRTTLVALAALPIAAGSIAITAPTASALDGYYNAPAVMSRAQTLSQMIGDGSFSRHVTHHQQGEPDASQVFGHTPSLDEWRGAIAATLESPGESFMARQEPAGGAPQIWMYWRHIDGMQAGMGMLVIYNRQNQLESDAALASYGDLVQTIHQVGIPRGTPIIDPEACQPAKKRLASKATKANAASDAPAPKTSSHTPKLANNSASQCNLLSDAKPAVTADNSKWAITRDDTVAVRNSSGTWAIPKDSTNTHVTAIATDQTVASNRLFARTVDNHLVYRDGANDDWHDLGSDIVTDPVAETHKVNGKDEQWVWGADHNGTLWERDTAAGSSWIKMPALPSGTTVASAPAILNNDGGRSAFVTDSKGNMDQLASTNGGVSWRWVPQGNAGTPLEGNLSAIQTKARWSQTDGSIWVSGIDKQGKIQEFWWNIPTNKGGWTRDAAGGSKLIPQAPVQGTNWNGIAPDHMNGTHIARATSTDGTVRTYYTSDGSSGRWTADSKPAEGKIVSPSGARVAWNGGGELSTESWNASYCVDEKGNLQYEYDQSAPNQDGKTAGVSWENLGHP